LSKKFAPEEGRRRIKNLKSKGYENCSKGHKLTVTHFGENLNFFDKILNKKMPKGRKVWPPGSHEINPFDQLNCGVSRRDINRSSHKKISP
jgi:hypothetical protein